MNNQSKQNSLILKVIITLSFSLVVLLVSSDFIGFYLTNKSHTELSNFHKRTMIPALKLQIIDQAIDELFIELDNYQSELKINNIQNKINKTIPGFDNDLFAKKSKLPKEVFKAIQKMRQINEIKNLDNDKLKALIKKWNKIEVHIISKIKSSHFENSDLDQYYITFKKFRKELHQLSKILIEKAKSTVKSSRLLSIKAQVVILLLLIIGLAVAFFLSKVSIKRIKLLLLSIEESHFEQNRLATLVQNSSDAIISINSDFVIKSWNNGACQIFGYSVTDIQGEKLTKLIKTDELKKLIDLIKSKQNKSLEILMQNKKKDALYCLISISILNEKNKKSYSLFIKDITETKKLQVKLEEQKDLSFNAAKLATVGEVAGGVAHEINNPLMIVVNANKKFSKFLEKNNFEDEKIYTLTKKSELHIIRITNIVKSLQTFSSSTADGVKKEVLLRDIIQDVLQLSYENIMSADIEFELNSYDQELKVSCRSNDITQVLINLIYNAKDAVKNLDEKWIELDIKNDAQLLTIKVTDSGSGISDEVVDKMMQPFFTTKEVGSGTGVGLSVAMGIVDSHDGHFYYDKACNNTCFVVELPI